MSFMLVINILAVAFSLIAAYTLLGYEKINRCWKWLLAAVLFACWRAPAVIGYVRRHALLEGDLFSILSYVGYGFFGVGFILFCLLIGRDAIWFSGYGLAKLLHRANARFSPMNNAALHRANMAVLLLTLLLSVFSLYQGMKISSLHEEIIYTPKVSREVTIVQVNDLHIDRSKPLSWLQKTVEKINALQPDAVVMVGDIIDDNIARLGKATELLRQVQSKNGVWFVAGNHELYNGLPSIEKKIREIGYRYLSKNGENVGDLPVYIAGLPDVWMGAESAVGLAEGKEDFYKILLVHNPKYAAQNLRQGFDLQLSGHTHGGQIFPLHILTLIANNFLAGRYELENGLLYISRGVGFWGPPMRLLAPSDITVIRLRPQI